MEKNINAPKVGRPRKDKADKAKYQHIAVHESDYLIFIDKVEKSGLKKVEVFHKMVKDYNGIKTFAKIE